MLLIRFVCFRNKNSWKRSDYASEFDRSMERGFNECNWESSCLLIIVTCQFSIECIAELFQRLIFQFDLPVVVCPWCNDNNFVVYYWRFAPVSYIFRANFDSVSFYILPRNSNICFCLDYGLCLQHCIERKNIKIKVISKNLAILKFNFFFHCDFLIYKFSIF